MFKNIITSIILVFTSSLSYASWAQWVEIDCNKISKNADIIHNYYKAENCWKSHSSSAQAWAFDFNDGEVYLWVDVQRIIDANTVWGGDYAYTSIKIDNIKNLIADYNLGISQKIDSAHSNIRSSNRKIKFNYRNFETSEGKGFFGGQSAHKTFFTFGFFTSNKNAILDEDFISEILSSLKIITLNKGENSSIRPINTSLNGNNSLSNDVTEQSNTSSESTDGFIQMCKNSKLSELDKDVAMLCLEKMGK